MTIKLHDLKPAQGSKTARTRVGRGEGSKGKTAGRGARVRGAQNVPVRFEGGQMPIHMRLPSSKASATGSAPNTRLSTSVTSVVCSPRAVPSAWTSW